MELAFIAAVGSIGFEDVAVAGFEFFQDTAFVDDTGAAVVSEAVCMSSSSVFPSYAPKNNFISGGFFNNSTVFSH